jgi:glycosyltransferase involved in cell wall biosynthesis
VNPYYHYLTIGRSEGRIATAFGPGNSVFDAMCAIIKRAPQDAASELAERRRDLRMRLHSGVLGHMVMRAAELEPLIHRSWPGAVNARQPPFHEHFISSTVAIHTLHAAMERRPARAIVVVPHCRMGGSIRVAGHLTAALCEIYGSDSVVVLRTDSSEVRFLDWFPPGCRNIDFFGSTAGLSQPERQIVLVELLRSLRPEVTFNVNSRLLWDLMAPYGKALASSMLLHAYMFCADKDVYGCWFGYPVREFYRNFDILDGVITDSHFLKNELGVRYKLSPLQTSKVVALETPVMDPPIAIADAPKEGAAPHVFWAGRFDRQKRIDTVFAIAERMNDVTFHLWGEPVADKEFRTLKAPKNVVLEGVYRHINELPLDRCSLWLYTSQWDGVPNVLLEVAALGIPIVGSLAGGCDEILIEDFAERIDSVEYIPQFERGIRRVLADPAAARERAARLRKITLERRTGDAYRVALKRIISEASLRRRGLA